METSPALANGTYTAQATQADAAGNIGTSQAHTFAISGAPTPTNTAAPTISGTARDGETLTADPGSWTGSEPISYAYEWRRCDETGAGCVAIAGATGQSYHAASVDVGSTLRVQVTAHNPAGSTSASSGATAVIVAASGAIPPAGSRGLPRGYWRSTRRAAPPPPTRPPPATMRPIRPGRPRDVGGAGRVLEQGGSARWLE